MTATTNSPQAFNILVTGSIPDKAKAQLEAKGHRITVVDSNAYVDENTFSKNIKGFEIYISGGYELCKAPVIEAADKLKAIIYLGADPASAIDVEIAKKKNIKVFNTPGENAQAVAEHTFLLMLGAARNISKMLKPSWEETKGVELSGKTLGIIGAGHIATNVAKKAEAFNMKILFSPSYKNVKPDEYRKSLHDLIANSDFISLHVPEAAGEIIGEQEFNLMKPHAILINTARAKLVNAEALFVALTKNKIKHAAFDVFYKEGTDYTNCPAANLLTLENFTLTKHSGWYTEETNDRLFEAASKHIENLS